MMIVLQANPFLLFLSLIEHLPSQVLNLYIKTRETQISFNLLSLIETSIYISILFSFHISSCLHICMESFMINSSSSMPSFITSSSSSNIMMMNMMTMRRMDVRIWSKLPHRLIDRVLAFLPPPAFFRARSVCKRWYSLLFSESFLEMYLTISPTHNWFIFFKHKTSLKTNIYRSSSASSIKGGGGGSSSSDHDDDDDNSEGFVYDPNENTWYRLSFASLIPSHVGGGGGGFSPASSSGGLICWVSDVAGSKSLILCNPLVNTFTRLPPTQGPRLFPSIGLRVTHSSFNLVVAGDDLISPFAVKNLTAESFHVDSSTGFFSMWGTTCGLPRLCSLEPSGRMVFVDGRFYCMNYSPFSVLVYDVGCNEWGKIQAPMRRFLRSPSVVECRGKLVLVGAVEKSKLSVPKTLRLWGLQGRNSVGAPAWVEIERMPNQLYEEFCEEEDGNGFDCVGHGDYIIIAIFGSDKMLLYDFYRKGWHWIPRCPFINTTASSSGNGGGGHMLHGFAYEPQLITPIMGLLSMT